MSAVVTTGSSQALRRVAAILAIALAGTLVASTIAVSTVSATPIKSTELTKFGDSGSSVVRLQQAIAARGFTIRGGVSGMFDNNTRLALKSLQKVAGFRATGVLDDRTAKFLGLVDVVAISESNLPKVGMSGDAVWSLQQALINNGTAVKGGADGKFGLATTIALGRFQSVKGLTVTKTLDKNTAVALGLVAAPVVVTKATKPVTSTGSAFPQSGDRSDAVRHVQQALLRNGITVNGGVDGIYGTATIAALAFFQGRRNLPANGIMDEPTAVALGLLNNTVVAVAVAAAPVAVAPVTAILTIETLPKRGNTSEEVRVVQSALIQNGIEVKGGADAVFGVATTIALGKFQEARGITVTKALDIQTAIALGVLPSVESMGLTKISVFPVQGPCNFIDTWLAPRSGGRQHLGVDITAARGNALYAAVDGVISQVTVGGALSGNALRVSQPDGTYFFYAHLDSFAPGIALGTPVRAGQVIGYVGSTGSAGTAHLHFEVHPFGGDAVSPYSVVKVVDACNVTTLLPQS